MARDVRFTPRLTIDSGSYVVIQINHSSRVFNLINISRHGFLVEFPNGYEIDYQRYHYSDHKSDYNVLIHLTGRKGNLTLRTKCNILRIIGDKLAAKLKMNAANQILFDNFFGSE